MAEHSFGIRIRSKRLALRTRNERFSLRRPAARLGIQPSHPSRLERGAAPGLSEEHITALAREPKENPDALLALAGKIPADVRRVLLDRPEAFAALIRALADRPDEELEACRQTGPLSDFFRETQRLARVGSFCRNLETGADFWSEEFFTIFGIPRDDSTPTFQQFHALVHPEDRDAVMAVRQTLLAGGGPLHYQYRFRRGDGLWRHAKAVAHGQCDESGRVIRILGTVQDITTERQALEDLRTVARFPEDNPHPVLRVTREGLLAYANPASGPLLAALGMALGHPVGSPLSDALIQAFGDSARRELDVVAGGLTFAFTIVPLPALGYANLYGRAVAAVGTERRLPVSRGPLRDAAGRSVDICAVGRDVTEWRQAADALATSEARYRRFFDDAVLGMFRATLPGRLLAANPALARLFGFDSPQEMTSQIGQNTALIYADPARRDEVVRRLAAGRDQGLLSFENPYRRKDGAVFIGNLHARLTTDEDGEQVVEGFIEDITERKQAETELLASEERLKTHLRNFPLPTLTFRLQARELRLTDANKAAEALFKGHISACLGSTAEAIFAEAPDVYLALWSAVEGRRGERRRLFFRPPGAGEPGIFDMTFVFAAPDSVMLHAEEITALARTREALRRTTDQLRGILEHVPCAIYFMDMSGRFIMVNRTAEEHLGRPKADIIGQTLFHVHPPEAAARLAEDDRRILASGRPATFEEEIPILGRSRRFLTTKTPLRDAAGEIYALCGISLDITTLEALERAVNAERDTLRTVLAYVPYAASLVSADGRTLFLNQRFIDLVGYTLDDIPDQERWLAKAYPDPSLRQRVLADWQSAQGQNSRRIFPVRCADGVTRMLDFKAVALPDGRMLLTMSEVDTPPTA